MITAPIAMNQVMMLKIAPIVPYRADVIGLDYPT
jgi:hypothetical protein